MKSSAGITTAGAVNAVSARADQVIAASAAVAQAVDQFYLDFSQQVSGANIGSEVLAHEARGVAEVHGATVSDGIYTDEDNNTVAYHTLTITDKTGLGEVLNIPVSLSQNHPL